MGGENIEVSPGEVAASGAPVGRRRRVGRRKRRVGGSSVACCEGRGDLGYSNTWNPFFLLISGTGVNLNNSSGNCDDGQRNVPPFNIR